MIPTQIRILIAESLGWDDVDHGVGPNSELVLGSKPMRDSTGIIYGYTVDQQPPDWPNDLDACHALEKTLTDVELWSMTTALAEVVPAKIPLAHANALQRCEAYLRVKNLWR